MKYDIKKARTSVTFTLATFLIAKARGRFDDVTGTITYEEGEVSRSSVEVIIKTASINTSNEGRDRHLRSADFFDVAKFPEMSFMSTRVEGKGETYLAVGDLTIHGMSKEVAIPFTIKGPDKITSIVRPPPPLAIEAILSLDRRDFGIVWSRLFDRGGVLIGNEVTSQISLEAVALQYT